MKKVFDPAGLCRLMIRDILKAQMGALRAFVVDDGCARFVKQYSNEGFIVFHEKNVMIRATGWDISWYSTAFGWEYVDRIVIMGH
jgi:hypothetical protein